MKKKVRRASQLRPIVRLEFEPDEGDADVTPVLTAIASPSDWLKLAQSIREWVAMCGPKERGGADLSPNRMLAIWPCDRSKSDLVWVRAVLIRDVAARRHAIHAFGVTDRPARGLRQAAALVRDLSAAKRGHLRAIAQNRGRQESSR